MGYGGSTVTLKETAENYYEVVDSCDDSGCSGGDDGGDSNTAPSASFTTSATTVRTGDTVEFDGSGSADADGSISSYDWEFGDGSTATGVQVSHSYGSPGDYTVTLTVIDDGATDAATTVTVESSSFDGYCGSDSNYDHAQAGHATTDGSYAYAEGSGENMGLYNTDTTTLKEASSGFYEIVDAC